MSDLFDRLKLDLFDADRALKHAADILATPHDRLGMAFSDCEIARAYMIQIEKALWGLQAWLEQDPVRPV
jgi:hypothetical protein